MLLADTRQGALAEKHNRTLPQTENHCKEDCVTLTCNVLSNNARPSVAIQLLATAADLYAAMLINCN